MAEYLVRRLLLIVPTIFLVAVLVFSMVRLLPGTVVELMVEQNLYARDAEALRHSLGLDKPVHQQFVEWAGGILQGDLGTSFWSKQPVLADIANRLPVSIELGVLALLFAVLIGIPLGVLSAVRHDTPVDYVLRSLAILLIAIPNFWLGMLLVIFPAIWWRWSPPLGVASLTQDPLSNLAQFALPAVVLGARSMGILLRMTQATMLEVVRQDYIRTAWAKGLRETVVLYRHALKNAFIPVITVIGLQIHFLVGGAVIVESIFGLPGMGRLIVQAVTVRDYPTIQALNLLFALVVVGSNLAVDLTYGLLDPRVRYR